MSLLIFFQNRFTEQTNSLSLFMSAYDVKNGSVDLFVQCGEQGTVVSGCDLFIKAKGLGRKQFEGAITRQKQGQTLSGSSNINRVAEHVQHSTEITSTKQGSSEIGNKGDSTITKTRRDSVSITDEA